MGEMIESELKEIYEPTLLSEDEYIETLNKYLDEHNLSTKEYVTAVANIHRYGLGELEEFEKKSPFITKENIEVFKEKSDSEVQMQLLLTTFIINNKNPIKRMTADECMGKNMKGLEISQGNNHSNLSLTARDPKTNQTTKIQADNIEAGYYVNFKEYIDSLQETITEEYPDATKVEIMDKDGRQVRRSDFCYATFEAIKDASKIMMGDVYKDRYPEDWSEVYYQYKYRKEQQKIGDIDFTCGLYARKEDLDAFVKNYRLKITTEKELNKETTNFTKK